MRIVRSTVYLATLCAAFVGAVNAGYAQTYPDKAIRLVVPLPPGGSTDVLSRALADKLRPELGQQVIVENVPGAGTALATQRVIAAAPDGYTILINSFGVALQSAAPNPKFDARKDLAPVVTLGESVLVMAVPADLPVSNIAEFVQYAKQRPGKLNFGSSGVASVAHVALELFRIRAGLDMVHIPYAGGAAMLQGILQGEVQIGLEQMGTIEPLMKEGKVKVLGVISGKRWPGLEKLPGMTESGVDMDVFTWLGIFAPAKTPAPVLEKLAAAINKVKQDPQFLEVLSKFAIQPSNGDLGKYVSESVTTWSEVINKAGIVLQ